MVFNFELSNPLFGHLLDDTDEADSLLLGNENLSKSTLS
jgi:hypothetical protein